MVRGFQSLLHLVGLKGNLHSVRGGITELVTMSETYVPLISSGTAGPLGVLHLPRLWQKVSPEEAGKTRGRLSRHRSRV